MKKRPVNLDLTTMKFPAMAIASILHRISGLLMFLGIPYILYCLHLSLKSPESFRRFQESLTSPYCKLLLWIFSAALLYHLLAGIRHMIMDLGCGESVCVGRLSAILTIASAIVLTIFLGIWIW